MNRFRTKKKAKEAPDGLVRASTDSETLAVPPVKSSKTLWRKKNAQPEAKPVLDLANALPPSDDFRTSLLMNGLSARFSMLREQDDPNSKLGKASDDSVLFPKQQSRFNDFNFSSNGLADIAEVSSVHGSIRPPFAMTRTDSFDTNGSYGTDDDSTLGGSIMNRTKPGESNNLFGGRQKIYKIPVTASGSTRSLAEGGGSGMGGRALYDDDVSQSAFQKLREREREQERRAQTEEEENEAHSSRPSSPPLSGYNRKRETSSTTSSGGPSITRSSTAATSFTSQRTPSINGYHTPITPGSTASNGGLERTTTKSRRLYETGLDQHLHEQQFSAMNRIDTLTRQRALGAQTPPLMNSPTSMQHPTEKWDRKPIVGQASLPNLRAASPPPTVNSMNTLDFALRSNSIPETKVYGGLVAPPLSPPMTEYDDPTILPVQPNDLGKATALGAFNKPVQPYDENKYTQRQLQMQQGRETPPRKHSPPSAFIPRQQQTGRTRAESTTSFASSRSRSNSSAQRQVHLSDSIRESQMPQPAQYRPRTNGPQSRNLASETFLSSPDTSIVTSPVEQMSSLQTKTSPAPLDLSKMHFQNRNINFQRPPESQHPALRQNPFSESPGRKLNKQDEIPSHPQVIPELEKPASGPAADSPTLGPITMTGLSGMVRQHLRSDSNNSSIYGGVSAGVNSRFPVDYSEPIDYSTKVNPWETGDWDRAYDDTGFDTNEYPQVRDQDNAAPVSHPAISGVGQDGKPSWEKELETQHSRGGSTGTEKEREDFHNDLAERRRKVQENLKSFVETESRSVSPLPGSEAPKSNPLGILRPKSSRGSLAVRQREPSRTREPTQSKAMKMLGIGNSTINSAVSPSKQNGNTGPWNFENEDTETVVPKGPTAFRQARRDAQRDREKQVALRHQQKTVNGTEHPGVAGSPLTYRGLDEPRRDQIPPNIRTRQRTPSRERKPPPVMHSQQESQFSVRTDQSGSNPPSRPSRDRSSSDTSRRSKSHNGRYRDEFTRTMTGDEARSGLGMYDEPEQPSARFPQRSPGTPGTPGTSGSQFQPSSMPSPMKGSPNGTARSNSRAAPSGYFESSKLHPTQMNDAVERGFSPNPPPAGPFPTIPAPPPPPASIVAAIVPTNQSFPIQEQVQPPRKRSINKADISEPTFVSSTSRITTINLPPEASLQNGIDSAPPIPPVNPMRRHPRSMFGLRTKRGDSGEIQQLPSATHSSEEMSTFSADEADAKQKPRQKLRKSSSEGGNLNAKARQAAFATPSPAMPSGTFPAARNGSPPRPMNGQMF